MDLVERAAQRLRQGDLHRMTGDQSHRHGICDTSSMPVSGSGTIPFTEPGDDDDSQAKNRIIRPNGQYRTVEIDLERLGYLQQVLQSKSKSNHVRDEFRHIKRNVISYNVNDEHDRSNVLLVTSALPNEGKTHIAVGLALSIASERDLTVLLVDADASRQQLIARLGIEADKGLFDLLEDPSLGMEEVIVRTNVERLSVIPAGTQHATSTELLASNRMSQLLGELRRRHPERVIIFDSSPLLTTTETAALTKHVGQVLLVVESEKRSSMDVEAALERISDIPKVGFVLNRVRPRFGAPKSSQYYYAKD